MRSRVVTFFLLAWVAIAPAYGQFSGNGLYLRPHLTGAAWSIDELDEVDRSGAGLGIGLAYGILERISFILDLSGSRMETSTGTGYILGHGDIGCQIFLTRAGSRVKIFAAASATARTARFDILGTHIDLKGKGGTLGVGAMYFMSRSVALDAGLKATLGSIDEISGGGVVSDLRDVRANSTRLDVGIAWFPMR